MKQKMKSAYLFIMTLVAIIVVSQPVYGQAQDPEKAEKELYKSIQEEVDRLAMLLDLNDYQIFYVDSILTHDSHAMREEMMDLQNKKVSNTDIYYAVRYKWQDKMYYAFKELFNDSQWQRYLKSGAERDKKVRDKKMSRTDSKKEK